MLTRVSRRVALGVVTLASLAVVLSAFAVWIRPVPRLVDQKVLDQQAAQIAAHREAQRADRPSTALPYGQIMLASGHILVVTETGELALVRAAPERHTEVGRFPVLEGRTWNHPAMGDGYLLIRNANEMAAFDLRVAR